MDGLLRGGAEAADATVETIYLPVVVDERMEKAAMKTAYAVIVPLGLASVLSTLCMYASPHWAYLILDVVTFVALLIFLVLSAMLGFKRWRRASRFWMVPTIVCVIFILVDRYTPAAGRFLADRQFKAHLTEYNEVVAEIRNTKNLQSAALVEMVRARHLEYLLHNVRSIKAERCEDNSIIVTFVLNTRVMLLHEGYLYKDYDNASANCAKEDVRPENKWPYLRPVVDNWYHFSDQPGL